MSASSGHRDRDRSSYGLLWRPTTATLFAFLVVFAAQSLLGMISVGLGAFALSLPLSHRPWTILLSVYAHANLAHLVANAVGVILLAPIVAYSSTPARFHAFFAGSGATAGTTQVVLTAPFGATQVLGASGAVFALFGYLLVANPVTDATFAKLSRRLRLLLIAALAVVLTLATAAPGVALLAHATGFLVGAAVGRTGLLAAD